MAERTVDRRDLVAALTKSPHGDLRLYAPVAISAAQHDPEYYAHVIAWNARKGQIRDAKVALPVLALASQGDLLEPALENALAHLADLPPRMFLQALDFAKDLRAGWDSAPAVREDKKKGIAGRPAIPSQAAMPVPMRTLRRLVTRYLRDLEADWHRWERTALQHRESLRALYARHHLGAGQTRFSAYETALFGPSRQTPDRPRPSRGKFAIVRQLATLSSTEIGGVITKYQIPFKVARGALGARAKEPDVVLALIGAMTDTELVTNMRALKRLGVQSVPALRGALELRLEKAGSKKRQPKTTLKATRAAEALADDEVLSTKLRALQERQLDALGSVDGRWLVLADKSASMEVAIETANQVAAVLARMAKDVRLVYFDTAPRAVDATGKTYEEIKALTSMMRAQNSTSIGCGVDYAMLQGWEIDGIALVTDGAENAAPMFADAYTRYMARLDKRVPVYWFHVQGDLRAMLRTIAQSLYQRDPVDHEYRDAEAQRDREVALFRERCEHAGIVLDRFDLTGGVDYYSVLDLCKTMKTNRYSLIQEIMETPLATLNDVLQRTTHIGVLPRAASITSATR